MKKIICCNNIAHNFLNTILFIIPIFQMNDSNSYSKIFKNFLNYNSYHG